MLLTVFSQLPYCLLLLLSIATLFTVFFCQLPRCLLFFLAISMLFSVFIICNVAYCFVFSIIIVFAAFIHNCHVVCSFLSIALFLLFDAFCQLPSYLLFLLIAKLFAVFFVNCQVVLCKMLTDVFCNLKMFFDVVCHFVS